MRITSLKIAKLLSFGPQQDLIDFTSYNLLIGKNGTGKTNTFTILQGLDADYEIVGDSDFKIQLGNQDEVRYVNVFQPSVFFKNYTNRQCHLSNIKTVLEIAYRVNNESNSPTERISFTDDRQSTPRYNGGDVSVLKKRVRLLKIPETDAEFYKDLALFFGNKAKSRLPFLNFALFYIFNLNYRFFENGTFVQAGNTSGGTVEENTTSLPSGVLNCAKVLTRYLMAIDEAVILIDEPELHMEPRALRKLFQFIVWLNAKGSTNQTSEERRIVALVESVARSRWNADLNISAWAVPECTPEERTTYHDITFNLPKKQLFVASHSSVLINEFLALGDEASIYKFDLASMDFLEYDPMQFPRHFSVPSTRIFTKVDKIANRHGEILDCLGCRGSDILQANGIVWVEGPSDIVYIQKWLSMYIAERGLSDLRNGCEFEFCMYGGALLKYLYSSENPDAKRENLVDILKLNTRAFLIVDSDKPDLNTEDKSTFSDAKQLMTMTLGTENIWCDPEVSTIEEYAVETAPKTWKYHGNCSYQSTNGKPERAFKRVQLWTEGKLELTDFKASLVPNIEKLYHAIESWSS